MAKQDPAPANVPLTTTGSPPLTTFLPKLQHPLEQIEAIGFPARCGVWITVCGIGGACRAAAIGCFGLYGRGLGKDSPAGLIIVIIEMVLAMGCGMVGFLEFLISSLDSSSHTDGDDHRAL